MSIGVQVSAVIWTIGMKYRTDNRRYLEINMDPVLQTYILTPGDPGVFLLTLHNAARENSRELSRCNIALIVLNFSFALLALSCSFLETSLVQSKSISRAVLRHHSPVPQFFTTLQLSKKYLNVCFCPTECSLKIWKMGLLWQKDMVSKIITDWINKLFSQILLG